MTLQDVSVFLDYIHPSEGSLDIEENLSNTRIRMRFFERYSTSQINQLVENAYQTIRFQISRLSNICYQTWLSWDSSTFFWTILPDEQESDRIANSPVIQEVSFVPDTEDAVDITKRIDFKEFNSLVSVFKSKKSDLEIPRTCCICLDNMEIYRMWAKLPCGHVMHSKCARAWLCRHSQMPTCPECRHNVRKS